MEQVIILIFKYNFYYTDENNITENIGAISKGNWPLIKTIYLSTFDLIKAATKLNRTRSINCCFAITKD